jgi:lipid A 3-O-deacylase
LKIFHCVLESKIYLGASAGIGDGADQVYGGFAWTPNVTDKLFVELGLAVPSTTAI